MKTVFLFVLLICGMVLAQVPKKPDVPATQVKATEAQRTEVQKTYDDIKKTLGIVPTFLKQYPPAAVTGAWEEMKSVQLSNKTSIPPRYKELIGLAVAAQVPCDYCTYFHSEAAKVNGGNVLENTEAVAVAAITRHWSTWLNGNMMDEASFRKEVTAISSFKRKDNTPTVITDEKSAQDDMIKTFGKVPDFMRGFPSAGVAGAWKNLKALEMENTIIPAKYKALIGVAVAAQIPCRYCLIFDSESAKAAGATEAEIKEAIAMSAITRHWSTFLNGSQLSLETFKNEARQIFNYVQKQNKNIISKN